MRHTSPDNPTTEQTRPVAPAPAGDRRSRRIDAFAPSCREQIAELARNDCRIEDLADSFPGLLFALATGHGTRAQRRTVLRAITAGRPLREAAALLGLPFWLRKLPALAFQRPLERAPADAALANRLVTFIPEQPAAIAAWLDRVLVANYTGRPDLALWTAQQYRGTTPAPTSESFLRTLAWCWFSGAPDTRGHELLGTSWKPGLGARRAAQEAVLWTQRIDLDVCLGAGIRDPWLADGMANECQFVALRTADDFIAEANAMDNCLDRYADRLEHRTARIFSIRRDGRSIANVEISGLEREFGMPAVSQLRGPRNRRAASEIWQATYAWLGTQTIRPADASIVHGGTTASRRKRKKAIWQPYLGALPEDARAAFAAAMMPPGGASARSRRRLADDPPPASDLPLRD